MYTLLNFTLLKPCIIKYVLLMYFQAKLLEEMDAEFGVGDLVAEDIRTERRNVYAHKDLKGLRVEHDLVC